MHTHDLRPFRHSHAFGTVAAGASERAMLRVTWLTVAAMAIELGAGWWSGSLALLADGWHMGTHALAIGGAALAYRLARRVSARGGYGFGGWKIEVLAAYTSGLALLAVAIAIVVDAIERLLAPRPIAYVEAIGVAAFGLAVNVVSAWWLGGAGHSHHAHGDGHRGHEALGHGAQEGHARVHDGDPEHAQHERARRELGVHEHAGERHAANDHAVPGHPNHHRHHDHNFAAAYAHVLADAITSLLAIVALGGGLAFGWWWLDAAAALLGAALIGHWSVNVLRTSAGSLIDARGDPALARKVREVIESDGDAKLADLHVWQVGNRAWAAELSVVADRPLTPPQYRERLAAVGGLAHVIVEVNRCPAPAGDGPGAGQPGREPGH